VETSETVTVKPISACTLVAKLVSSDVVMVSVKSAAELAVVVLKEATRSNEVVHV
jgi:hypothetical protein